MVKLIKRRKMEENKTTLWKKLWRVWCPDKPGNYWITVKICGKSKVFLTEYNGFIFIPIIAREIAPIKPEEVIAYIPLMAPNPYVKEKECPFCKGVVAITEDDTVTCFKCDYTVKLSVWESR